MKAGRTNLECGTRVRIVRIGSSDPVAQDLVGATGTVTHPFGGLMRGQPETYLAGILLDRQFAQVVGDQYNLAEGDSIEPLPERIPASV